MKIFIFHCNQMYGGGLAIVAHFDAESAFDLLAEEFFEDEIYDYTDLKHCRVNDKITPNVEEPTVIDLNFYKE